MQGAKLMVDLHRTPKPEPESDGIDEQIAESFVSLAKFARHAMNALTVMASQLGRIADSVEGIERREARLEEALTSVEQSNRRLAAAMERLHSAE